VFVKDEKEKEMSKDGGINNHWKRYAANSNAK